MGYHVTRAEAAGTTPPPWIVEQDGVAIFSSPDPAAITTFLFDCVFAVTADASGNTSQDIVSFPAKYIDQAEGSTGRQWKPLTPLTREEINLVVQLNKRLQDGGQELSPAECLEALGRAPIEVERLARVSEPEADSICQLRRAGWSYRKIHELTGRNTNTIAKIIADDMQGSRRSDKKWRCRGCGALNLLDHCETCRINRLANSRRLNLRDAKRHGLEWYRKINGRPRRTWSI